MSHQTIINKITLILPHGVTTTQAQEIAQSATDIAKAGVSEGGFEQLEGNLMFDEKVTWSDDSMIFVYGHKREGK